MKYAAQTEVGADKSKAEIERILVRYGATAFMHGWECNRAMIGFEAQGRRYRIVLPLPNPDDAAFTRTPARGRPRSKAQAWSAWEQATRQRWRALVLWIKAVLEAVECGITTLEGALQPFVVLPDGRTTGEWLSPQIEQAYDTGRMPPMLPAPHAEES